MKTFNFFERLWEHSRTLRRVGLVLVMCLITIGNVWGEDYVWKMANYSDWSPSSAGTSNTLGSYDGLGGSASSSASPINLIVVCGGSSDKIQSANQTISGTSYTKKLTLNGNTGSTRKMTITGLSGTGTMSIVCNAGGTRYISMGTAQGTPSGNSNTANDIAKFCENTKPQNTVLTQSITTTLSSSTTYYININNSVDIYAIIWTPASGLTWCTITYDKNSGTGTNVVREYQSGAIAASPNFAFTRDGYVFTSWNTKADGSGTRIEEGASITLSKDTTLYAQWVSVPTSGDYYGIEVYNVASSGSATAAGHYRFAYSGSGSIQLRPFIIPKSNDYDNVNQFWVGKNGEWKNNGLGNSNAKSANAKFSSVYVRNEGSAIKTIGNGAGMIGRLRLDDNSMYDNLDINFIPQGFGFRWGSGDWSTDDDLPFHPGKDANVWETDIIQLTSTKISGWSYYVGALKNDGTYAYFGASNTSTLSSMGNYTTTWDGTVGSKASDGDYGIFRMWTDQNYDNYRCHYVPYYVLKYNANSGSGAPEMEGVNSSANEAGKTLKISSTIPTYTGYEFKGWATSSDNAAAGTVAYSPGDNITLEANTELFAVWSCIVPDAPTADKISVSDQCQGTGVTFTANTTGIPSYVTWYWQDAADGISTSNPATSDFTTATTPGTYTKYLRAKNTVCGTWSASGSTPSKSAKVKTAATVSWNAHPTAATYGDGGKTFSVTTNYAGGLVWTLENNTCDATLTGEGTSRTLSYTGVGSVVVKATVTGSGDSYCSSAVVSETLTVGAATPTATFANGEYTIGGSALDLSTLWTSNSSGAVTYTVTDANGTGATIAGSSFTATTAGTASVRASQAANGNYSAITKDATITVNPAADVTPPTLSSSTPTNGATNVAVSGNIVLTFSENVSIVDASKFSLTGGAGTLNTAGATVSGAAVTIPYSGLANNTTYTLAGAAGAVQDAAGNNNAALSSFSFTTVAAAPAGDCDMYFWFNAAADATSASVTNNEGSFFSGTLPSTSSTAAEGSMIIDGKTYNVTKRSSNGAPSVSFTVPENKTGKLYAIVIAGGTGRSVQLKQGSTLLQSIEWETTVTGHDFDAVPAGTYTITSAGNMGWCMLAVKICDDDDETAPTLSSSVPANSATDIAVSGNIVLTFSENVTIVDVSKFSLTGGAGTLSTGSATVSGAVVTIPYSGLANSTEYTFSTAAGAVRDAAGNTSAALSNIVFTTVAAPVGAPVITVQPTLSEVALGETASFSLTATGATSYQWYSCDSEGENKTEASGASATTDNYSYTTTATGTTYYICKVSNASGDTWSDVVGSIVNPVSFTIHYEAGSENKTSYTTETFTQKKEVNDEVEDYIGSLTKFAFTGVSISDKGKDGTMSMKISMPTSEDAGKYVSFTFTVAPNYYLSVDNIDIRCQPVDHANHNYKVVLTDALGTTITGTSSTNTKGELNSINFPAAQLSGKRLVGLVTVKIFGWYSSSDTYRLAKNTYITGTVSSLPAPTASWTARPASATVGDGGKTYTLTTDGTNTVAWSITDQSDATGAVLSSASGLTTTLSSYSEAGSLYVQAAVTGDGIHYLSTPATLLRQRVVISGDCSETTLISATLSSGTATGSVTGTPGGTSAVSFTSVKEVDGGYKMGGDGSYVYLTLSGDENFAANDEVKITITKASDQGDGALHIYKYADASWTELGSVTASGAGTYSYTLTETNVSTAFNTIGLYRTGSNQNPYVKALSVVRNSCSATKPSGVTVTASPAGPYAIGATPTLTVSATNADTYQWYSNTNNTASDGFLLVGETAPTYSPSTAIAGTTYYYCVATNASGSTVSNIITVTVNSAKTAPTVSWTDTYETPNYGGGGYAVKATVSTAEWDGTLTTDMLTASDGVTLTGVSVSGKVITATYGVTETARSPLSFSLTLPETTKYTALAANKEITFTRCGEGAVIETTETKLPVKSSYTTASNPTYRWETAEVGWFTLETGASSISSESSSYSGFSNRSKSGKKYVLLYSELDAVKAVRLYVNGTGDNTTLSKVRTGTTYNKYKELKESTDYDFTYSNSSTSIASRENAYIEISFKTNLTANTFVEITLSRNTLYYGVELLTGSTEVGTIDTDISWADPAPSATVNKTTTDANFRYEAEKASDAASQATLGTISYKSSVPAVATVSATGVVDVLGVGNTTITATLSSSGCYKKATKSYNLVVAEATCTDDAGTIAASGTDITIDGNTVTKADACAAVTLTVSGHTGENDGATYQWYKDGVSMGESYRSKSISVTDNGDYTVEVTNAGVEHCTMPATNTITITGEAISITKIVDEWYVKNGRRTPDIALATIEGTTSYTVNDGSSNITTFAGCGFELRDGILYLKGTQDDGSAPSGLAAGDVTLTITAVSACGGNPTANITIHKQDITAKPSIAFIVDGTKGDPVNSVATTKTSSRPIWIYLSESFDLTGCNAYWTNNEKQIRQYYSQFDAIVITDDPSTDTKPASGLKYVNALGTMVDVRPILTMEAYVGKYGASSNWHIGGTPSSPNPRQYELKLQCKDHDIFSDLTPSANFRSEEIDGETYYYVTMVDNSVTPYAGLADDAETETYPALQGFSAASIKGTGLLGIGTISDGTLQGGVERQDEPTARMMILGIQHQAMAALTSEGKQVIKNAINYLLKTDMEEVDDCSNYFIGGTVGHEQEWHTASNWSSTKVPDASTKARIMAPVTISTTVHVAQVDIATGGTSIHYKAGSETCGGSVTIASTGALIVDGQVRRTTNGRLYTEDELQPTTPADLTIQTSPSAQGALIFDNSDGETQATVEMYSPSYWEIQDGTNKKKSYWSYVGVPIQDVPVGEYFYGAVTYLYDETSGWIRKRIGSEFHAFEGIGLSLPEGNRETFYGTLASTETKEITLTKTTGVGEGDNLIGNSWTAPIQIGNFDASDFGSATAVVSMYKTGRDDIEGNPTVVTATAANDGAVEAGQWVSIPIGLPGTDGYDGPTVIPSMQAFQVTTSSETTLTLDYDKLVRDVTIATDNLTQPMSAPKRKMKHTAKKSLDAMMRVRMSGFKTRADLWIMEDGRFSDEYDNGWEANYIECDNRSPQLYANSEIGKMAFLAKPDIEGTTLGIAPSRDGNEYLFTFHYVGDEEFYLNDLKLKQSVLISEEESYSFMYEDGDTNRFYISRTRIDAPQMPTGVENTHGDAVKARKFIYNDKLYIMLNGRVYSAEGQLVK